MINRAYVYLDQTIQKMDVKLDLGHIRLFSFRLFIVRFFNRSKLSLIFHPFRSFSSRMKVKEHLLFSKKKTIVFFKIFWKIRSFSKKMKILRTIQNFCWLRKRCASLCIARKVNYKPILNFRFLHEEDHCVSSEVPGRTPSTGGISYYSIQVNQRGTKWDKVTFE